jgi:4-alpha-glucanotransferase
MYEQSESELLRLLAERAGIAADYYDMAGTLHVTTDETRRAILAAMNFRLADRAALIGELTAWDNRNWVQGCDPVRIVRSGQDPGTWSLHVPCESADDALVRVRWRVYAENDEKCHEREEGPGLTVDDSRFIGGRRYIRLTFALPSDLPLGYYEAQVSAQGGSAEVEAKFRVIVAPDRCYIPDLLQKGTRLWGVALQLYSLRSDRNWGMGDFQDLAAVVEWAGTRLGASVVGLNPLHALRNSTPYHISPYSPLSRLFLNDLYLDIEQVEECRTAPEVRARLDDASFRAQLEAARKTELVDYDAVASAKRAVLDLCYRAFLRDNFEGTEPESNPTTARGRSFAHYVQQEGEPLAQFALFQALEDERQFVQSSSIAWMGWPEPYRTPTSEAVSEFKRRHMKQVRFFQYVQWLASDQLNALVKKTAEAGMAIGLYHDLALGSDRAGADGWRFQDVLALQADCGAPPDPLGPDGQNWGFSPADPIRLRASGYRYFIELLRSNLRYGGAIRLDHVMALFRLFWIPRGLPASAGAYVHYPADDLLAILALESVRANALVIGEDLGTVPDWVRDRLRAAGILSYRVFYFEREAWGAWKLPAAYPAQSIAVVTTHDLPTLRGYWEGADIETRVTLGLLPSEETRMVMLEERHREKAGILRALKSEGLLPSGVSDDPALTPTMTEELVLALHRYLARTPAWLVLATLEDVISSRAQTNVPGTVDQHPNWCRKLGATVEELVRDTRFERLAAQLRSERPLV